MNSQQHSGPPLGAVIVGLGLDGSEAALTFAADEARRTQCPLHVVHVLRISGAEAYAGVLQGALDLGEATVAQGLDRARELVDGRVPVTAERVDDGWLVADLLDRASRGSMLVLQHRRQSALHRLVTGSIVADVASRCAVPVVSVPEDWRPGASDAVVTVGVQDAAEAEPLIRRGLVEAHARGARLDVLSAWQGGGVKDSEVERQLRADHETRITHALAPALAAACGEVPGVPVQLTIEHAAAAQALLAAGRSSQFLVIGRHHHLLPLGSHLGPTARALLQHSTAPVLLVPASPRDVSVAVEDAATAPPSVQPA
jgi:nucleotide-binding universal stress UspA family protein